jgi:hypothetical protein
MARRFGPATAAAILAILAPAMVQAAVRLARVEVDSKTELTAYVEVTSEDKAKRDLIPAEFQLFVDGKPLNPLVMARSVHRSGIPLAVVLVIDATEPWAGEPWRSAVEGLRAFLSKLKSVKARVGLVVIYGTKVAKLRLTTNLKKVDKVLGRFAEVKGKRMAVAEALRKAAALLGGKRVPWRREIVMVHHGKGALSGGEAGAIAGELRRSGIGFNAIYLPLSGKGDEGALKRLARSTGGHFRHAYRPSGVARAFRDTAEDLFALHLVNFRLGEAETLKPGSHKVLVDYMGVASKAKTIKVGK